MTPDTIFKAHHAADMAAKSLLTADSLARVGHFHETYIGLARRELARAADALGFDLVEKPFTVISKHDFMERVRRATATDGMKQDASGNLYQRD